MSYQPCRWYDLYPGLAFVLKLVRLMPYEKQVWVGERLKQYLAHRMGTETGDFQPLFEGNRWYDNIPSLVTGLEQLKTAPPAIKQQSSDFLIRILEQAEAPTNRCA